MDLDKIKVKKGIIWVLTQRLFLRIFSFLRIPILARLISPEDFGLFGIITTILYMIDVLTRTGFQNALIQKKENVEAYLDVAWTINLIRGVIQTTIIVLVAQSVANFYDEQKLIELILFSSLSPLINSFESMQTIILRKKLQLKILSLFTILVSACGFGITIGLALYTRNIWALVWGTLVQTAITTIGSYFIAPYRPHFNFELLKIKDLWSYGKWEFLSGLLLTIILRGDNLFVGKVLGVAAVGYYSMAYNIGNMVTTEIVDSIRGVIFPAFSSIQDDIPRLKTSYLTIFHFTALIGFIFTITLNLLAPQFVEILLGQKWMIIVPTLQVLALLGGVQMLSTSTSPLFRAINQPDWYAKIQALKLVIFVIIIYPFSINWGITGTAYAALTASLIEIPIGLFLTKKTLVCSYRDILLPLIAPLISATIITISYLIIENQLNFRALPHLIIIGTLIFFLYICITLFVDHFLNTGLWKLIKETIQIK